MQLGQIQGTIIINKPYLLPSTCSVPARKKKTFQRLEILASYYWGSDMLSWLPWISVSYVQKKSHVCTEKLHFFTCNEEKPCADLLPPQFCPPCIDITNLNPWKNVHNLLMVPFAIKHASSNRMQIPETQNGTIIENKTKYNLNTSTSLWKNLPYLRASQQCKLKASARKRNISVSRVSSYSPRVNEGGHRWGGDIQ